MANKKTDYAALAKQAVEQGAVPTAPSTLYFMYTSTNGDEFVGRATAAETYLRKGYTIGAEVEIDDLVAWNAEQSAAAPPTPPPAPAAAPAP
jgi:hypothetical protein